MARAVPFLLTIVAAGLLTFGGPAHAGEAETAYLNSLAGNWTGSGTISGPDGGKVSCRLVMKPSGDRLNFNGRCAATGGAQAQSFSGTIRYSDQRRRYESSSSGITVIGEKSGSTLTFVTEQETIQGDISSTMTVSPQSMKMQFRVVTPEGGTNRGTIPFKRG